MKAATNKGFTLVEMAIVMAIIGLLTGGILLGKDLIHSSQLRATLNQIHLLDTSYAAFRLKYNCIPGDCINASELGFQGEFSIILAEAKEPAKHLLSYLNPISDAYAFMLLEYTVCAGCVNGNGNGKMDLNDNVEGPISLRLLQQAKLLPSLDLPTTKLLLPIPARAVIAEGMDRPAFWFVNYLSPDSTSLIREPGHYYTPVATLVPVAGASVIKPSDAAHIDVKHDDGLPLRGKMRASTASMVDYERGPAFISANHQGPAGGTSNFCVTNQETYNVLNTNMLCSVVVKSTSL